MNSNFTKSPNTIDFYKDRSSLGSHSSTWYGERLLEVLGKTGIQQFLPQGLELKNSRHVLDFSVSPGRIAAKILLQKEKLEQIQIAFEQFSENEWSAIFEVLAERAFFLAKLLAGDIPSEIDQAFEKAIGKPLIPRDFQGVTINSSITNETQLRMAGAALFWKFWERLGLDPFLLFTLRGIGRDETLTRLRFARLRLRSHSIDKDISTLCSNPSLGIPHGGSIAEFWNFRADLTDIHYTIRADELPALILKRMDPIPLAGIEEEAEPLMEEAYAQIARRAQAFGLGFIKRGFQKG